MARDAPDYWLRGQVIELIKKVELIEEITLIKKVEELTKLGELGVIQRIRDVTLPIQALIINPSFEQDLTGWFALNPDFLALDEEVAYPSPYYGKSLKFIKGVRVPVIGQKLPLAIDPAWFKQFYFWLRGDRAATGCFSVSLRYYDDDFETLNFDIIEADKWERKIIIPTKAKPIAMIYFFSRNLDPDPNFQWLDDITFVF